MSNAIALRDKFAGRVVMVDVDAAAAAASNSGGSSQFFRVKAKAGEHAVIRVLPSTDEKLVVGFGSHFVSDGQGKGRSVTCLKYWHEHCPFCALHEEAVRTIGVPDPKSRSAKPQIIYHLKGDEYENGFKPKSLFLVMVAVQKMTDMGTVEWEGPQPMEMSTILFEKIFGHQWKKDTYPSRLTAKSPLNICDVFDSYPIVIRGAGAPNFYTVDIVADRQGAHVHGPLFTGDDAEERFTALFDALAAPSSFIQRPDPSFVAGAVANMRAKLDESIEAMHGGPVEFEAEVADATTVMATRRAPTAQPALPAAEPVARRARAEAPVYTGEAAPPTRSRAASTAIMLDEDEV